MFLPHFTHEGGHIKNIKLKIAFFLLLCEIVLNIFEYEV